MEFKDYYATLGLTKAATDAEIKRAFRKLARQHHPDLNPGDKAAEAKFKAINEANEVLSDPEKRRKYDELGANWRQYEQAQPGHGAPGWDGGFEQAGGGFEQAGGARYRTMTPEEMQELFGGQDPFSDFFHTFFGGEARAPRGGRSTRSARPARGHDLEQTVDLTLEEAFHGATRRVVIARNGQERTVDIRIPAGVKDGARVRAAGEGGEASPGGQSGDLYLTVRILPHPRFERRGQDLHARMPVPVATAVLGGEVTVPTLDTPVRLKLPALTTQGRVFRLRGHGMPTVGNTQQRGDLYATADIQVPSQLTDEQRKHYEALRALDDARN